MHNGAASAYAKTAKITQSPRELEAGLLLKAAFRLQSISDDWATAAVALEPALTFNRRIWTILASSATSDDNPLPEAVKVSIAQLAGYVFQRTLLTLADPAPAKLGVLVRINREIAMGLRASAPAPMAAAAG